MMLKTLSVTGGERDDLVALGQSIVAESFTAALGNGNFNDLDIANTQLGSLTVTGFGLGSASISTTVVTGAARFAFVSSVSVAASNIGVAGPMSVISTITGSFASTAWTGSNTLGSLAVQGGDDAIVTLSIGSALTVAGDVALIAKHDDATLNITEAALSARNLTLTSLGEDVLFNVNDTTAATSTITLVGGLKMVAFDAVTYDQRDGAATVAKGVQTKGTGTVTVTVQQDCSLTTPADVLVISTQGSATFNLQSAALDARNLTVTGRAATYSQVSDGATVSDLDLSGSMTLKATVDVAKFDQQNGTADVTGRVTVAGRDEAEFAQTGAAVTTTLGKLTLTAGQNAAALDVTGQSLTVNGEVSVTGFTRCNISLLPTAISDLGGNVSVKGGVDIDNFASGANVRFLKNLTIAQGAGGGDVQITGSNTTTTVGGNLTITTGSGNDDITVLKAGVAGATKITTGAGSDPLTIDSSVFRGTFLADTGAGDDFIDIAQATTVASPVTFSALATILAGAGNDRLRLGLAVASGGNADSKAQFAVALANKIDGGAGLNSFDDEAGQFTGIVLGTGIVGWTDPT